METYYEITTHRLGCYGHRVIAIHRTGDGGDCAGVLRLLQHRRVRVRAMHMLRLRVLPKLQIAE